MDHVSTTRRSFNNQLRPQSTISYSDEVKLFFFALFLFEKSFRWRIITLSLLSLGGNNVLYNTDIVHWINVTLPTESDVNILHSVFCQVNGFSLKRRNYANLLYIWIYWGSSSKGCYVRFVVEDLSNELQGLPLYIHEIDNTMENWLLKWIVRTEG